jgi:hypothetical protein
MLVVVLLLLVVVVVLVLVLDQSPVIRPLCRDACSSLAQQQAAPSLR